MARLEDPISQRLYDLPGGARRHEIMGAVQSEERVWRVYVRGLLRTRIEADGLVEAKRLARARYGPDAEVRWLPGGPVRLTTPTEEA